jgi:hypothetical protein
MTGQQFRKVYLDALILLNVRPSVFTIACNGDHAKITDKPSFV